jgi:hypothetical protein
MQVGPALRRLAPHNQQKAPVLGTCHCVRSDFKSIQVYTPLWALTEVRGASELLPCFRCRFPHGYCFFYQVHRDRFDVLPNGNGKQQL